MDIYDFILQISKIKEKELKKRVWEIWLSKYPFMTSENYISYEEMLSTVKQQEIKQNISVNGVYVDQVLF